jgi:hypothetical protein
MSSLRLDEPACLGIVGLFNQVPYSALRVAETGKGAQALRVGEQHRRSFDGLSLLNVRLATGRSSAVEVSLRMGAITERLVVGLATSAKRILLRGWVVLAFPYSRDSPSALVTLDCSLSGSPPLTK